MGKTLTYGEFKFGKTPAKPASKGYAKGGETKGQAKIAKVMGEFKSGALHSGSKKGPVVSNPKQAVAIALSEKKAAGYKSGGKVGLWDNIHAKQERIKNGSDERMRKPGSKGAPTAQDFKDSNVKMKEGGKADLAQDKALIKKAFKQHDAQEHKGGKGTELKLKKGGQSKLVGMKREPDAIVKKEVSLLKKAGAPAKIVKHEETEIEPTGALTAMKKGGKTKAKKYAEGGSLPLDKTAREQKAAYDNHYKREEAENLADRKAAKDALMYIPNKIKEGAKSVYNTVMGKKAGGAVKKGVPTFNRMPKC